MGLMMDSKKPVVPQVAIDYYNKYKDLLTSFEEWFNDFYDEDFLIDFPKGGLLAEWLYDNDNKTNGQRELALAMLIVNGIDAVEVEKEKKYSVRVKNTNSYLVKSIENTYLFLNHIYDEIPTHSKSELEVNGFFGIFDNPMFEIKEVE